MDNTEKKARNTVGLKPAWKKGIPSPNPYGRPKIKEEVKAVKDANYQILNELVIEGKYREIILETIESQRKQGKIDVLKFLSESVIGKEPVKIPNPFEEMLE